MEWGGLGGADRGVASRRPLFYPGRLALPFESDSRARLDFFKNAALVKRQVTPTSEHLRTRDLKQIEDLSAEALPATTVAQTHASQVEKYQQLGMDAAQKLLQSMLCGPAPVGRSAFAIVDLSTRTGDLACAYAALKDGFEVPVFYLGLCQDERETEWAAWEFRRFVTEGLLEARLRLAACNLPPAEMPQDIALAPPPKPDLNVLVWQAPEGDSSLVKIPDAEIRKWCEHAEFGPVLHAGEELVARANEEGHGRTSGWNLAGRPGSSTEATVAAEAGRPSGSGEESSNPAKRRRLGEKLEAVPHSVSMCLSPPVSCLPVLSTISSRFR